MTHSDTRHTSLSDKAFVLATDLDGTFLGGTEKERKTLYSWIEANRDSVGLIFVTGRDPGFIHSLTRKQGVPRPDYVVGDVGTTIASVDGNHQIAPIAELEAPIAQAWGDATLRVQSKLNRFKGIRPQSGVFRHRMSYDLDPDHFEPAALDVIAEMGLDALVSDNRFLDVLPKDISKGPSLLRLLSYLDVPNQRCLAAGDTLNDLSMLALGLPAVAVGNSEPRLIEALEGKDHVHFASGHGAAGIAEAILAFDFIGRKAA
ncbi:HAD-IIB family hydrolase [Cognatishimia sp. F0-27]|uniref:HAD-IIB family hydrolase n=1 Tax=Cognatishimia sp. F0-27 TaxID=2816855 RepID=UPI001D0CB74C|nr:HAD-IIB family hydrolase [Cognatishimia sp. F0-27]MCC1494025.1 HAD-IIB family hydrolase [Cognatishimia sp. F0-27]